jgi:hypothetical protein
MSVARELRRRLRVDPPLSPFEPCLLRPAALAIAACYDRSMPSPRRINPKIEEERKAAKNAKAVLGGLTPSSTRTDRTIFVLRYAANVAATNMLTRHLESKIALDAIRDEAAKSLNAVCSLLERRRLTQDVIDQANRAVEAWLSALPAGSEPIS